MKGRVLHFVPPWDSGTSADAGELLPDPLESVIQGTFRRLGRDLLPLLDL